MDITGEHDMWRRRRPPAKKQAGTDAKNVEALRAQLQKVNRFLYDVIRDTSGTRHRHLAIAAERHVKKNEQIVWDSFDHDES